MECGVCDGGGVWCESAGLFPRKIFSPGPYWAMRAANPPLADARGRRQSGRFARWPSALPQSGPGDFFAGKNVKFTVASSHGFGSSSAAWSRLAAVAGGAFRAICVPRPPGTGGRQGTRRWRSHLATDCIRHPPPPRLHLRFSSSPQPLPSSPRSSRVAGASSWRKSHPQRALQCQWTTVRNGLAGLPGSQASVSAAASATPMDHGAESNQASQRLSRNRATLPDGGKRRRRGERREGGGDGTADGERSPRRGASAKGACPGGGAFRHAAGRRSPGMRRQPPPLADTEQSERAGAAADWQRCPRRLNPRKLAWPRLRRGGRPTREAARLASAASVRQRRIGRPHCPVSAKKQEF